MQYPHEKEAPPIRARGVIALHEENCTVCMLCARSCPDWCIYIEGHKEKAPPRRAGRQAAHGQPRSTASTSTTRCACTAASASRSARSTRCSGARSTSTPSRASPTCSTTRTSSASGWRPCPRRRTRSRSREEEREEVSGTVLLAADDINVAQNIGFGIIAAVDDPRRAPRRHHQERRARRALAGGRARRRRRAVHPAGRRVRRRHPGARLHRRRRSCCSSSASCSPGPRSAREQRPQQPATGRSASPVAARPARRCSATCCIDAFGDDELPDRAGADRRPSSVSDSIFVAVPDPVRGAVVRPARRRSSAPSSWPGRTEPRAGRPTSSCSARCCSASASTACSPARTRVLVLMSIELILNAVNINLVAFALMHGSVDGQVFALFVIAVAAAEVGVGPRDRAADLPQPPLHRARRARPR